MEAIGRQNRALVFEAIWSHHRQSWHNCARSVDQRYATLAHHYMLPHRFLSILANKDRLPFRLAGLLRLEDGSHVKEFEERETDFAVQATVKDVGSEDIRYLVRSLRLLSSARLLLLIRLSCSFFPHLCRKPLLFLSRSSSRKDAISSRLDRMLTVSLREFLVTKMVLSLSPLLYVLSFTSRRIPTQLHLSHTNVTYALLC